jgi:hypothetical protein
MNLVLASSARIVHASEVSLAIIEAQSIDGTFQLFVTFLAALLPSLEPFEVEQQSHLRVIVGHPQERFAEALNQVWRSNRTGGHIAMIVARSPRKNSRAASSEDSFRAEEVMVAIDHTGRIRRACHQGGGRLTLTPYVIAVFAREQVMAPDTKIDRW